MSTVPELVNIGEAAANDDVDLETARGQLAGAIRRVVDLQAGVGASFGEREAATLAVANEGTRRCLEEDLQRIADGIGERVLIDGELHRRVLPGEISYHSLVGNLRVKRYTYRPVAKRNAPTVVALDLAAGIMQRATPALAYVRLSITYHARIPDGRT